MSITLTHFVTMNTFHSYQSVSFDGPNSEYSPKMVPHARSCGWQKQTVSAISRECP